MICIGDVHGNFDTLMGLLSMIPQEEKDKGIVLCGDLIDRGPKSRQVVQWAIDNNIHVIMGNHEKMMIDEAVSITSVIRSVDYIPNIKSLWLGNGGFQTTISYSEYDQNDLNERGLPTFKFDFAKFMQHVEWMKNLPLYLEFPVEKDGRKLVASHSNVGNVWDSIDLIKTKPFVSQAILWGRPIQIKDAKNIYNVIGHTPQPYGARIRQCYANIDTGCFYKQDDSFKRLTALQFPEMIIYEHENIDGDEPPENPVKTVLTAQELHDRKKHIHRRGVK